MASQGPREEEGDKPVEVLLSYKARPRPCQTSVATCALALPVPSGASSCVRFLDQADSEHVLAQVWRRRADVADVGAMWYVIWVEVACLGQPAARRHRWGRRAAESEV